MKTKWLDFLDDQYLFLEGKRNKLVEAGRIGGKATLKRRLSYKDKDNNKDNNKNKDKYKKERIFYFHQITLNKKEKLIHKYIAYIDYLFGKNAVGCIVEHILELEFQLKFSEYKQLFKMAKDRNIAVADLLDNWLNKPSYSDGNISVFLNLKGWILRNK